MPTRSLSLTLPTHAINLPGQATRQAPSRWWQRIGHAAAWLAKAVWQTLELAGQRRARGHLLAQAAMVQHTQPELARTLRAAAQWPVAKE